MGGYSYKILIFESINELKLRRMTFNCQQGVTVTFLVILLSFKGGVRV